ncbi:MAG: hypothetical protein ACK4E0_14565 [Chitinophagaceae bacterium]
MEFHRNKATDRRPEGDRVLDASFVVIDNVFASANLKAESETGQQDKVAFTVFKSDELAIVLVQLSAGESMDPGKTSGTMLLQPKEGRIQVKVNDQLLELENTQMMVIHPEFNCSILAIKDSQFFLMNCMSRSFKKKYKAGY